MNGHRHSSLPAVDARALLPVGPVLEAGPVATAIVSVIRAAHPDVSVQDRGAYLRVSVPGRCVLSIVDLERMLGTAFPLPGALEQIMPSFEGRMHMETRHVVWEVRRP